MRRLHFFKHPWVLSVRYRSAFDNIERELVQGDTLTISFGGDPHLHVKFNGSSLEIVHVGLSVSADHAKLEQIWRFAETEARCK